MTKTLLDIISYRGQSQPDQLAYIFLQNGETESGSLTYGELDRQARAIASHLQSMRGERALLLYPSGLEFITAFFGCLYAGVIAVPVYPPRRNQKLSRLLSIANDAQAKLALTTTSILADIDRRWDIEPELLANLKWVATDIIETNLREFVPRAVTPESLAFLQYTSGSTGTPKGVMVTHGNIIHNQQLIHQAFGHSEQSIGVGWLPLFHDMGLIGHVFQPIYVGFPCILMPPVAFLMKPIRWLKVIAKYRATISGGPNFAYDLCQQKIKPEQLENLDLSSWQVAFNGAEPVKAKTLEQFANKFAPCGFAKNAFYPCYGMAEATLFVTGGNKNNPPLINQDIVGCGYPWLEQKIVIVEPETFIPCREGETGEIWISGKSVARGYWRREQETKETFQARISNSYQTTLPNSETSSISPIFQGDKEGIKIEENQKEYFFRTGDLGFLLEGELFIKGRLKELIIIRGENHYPHDIERIVEESDLALCSNAGAVFTIEVDGQEKLVIVQEVKRSCLKHLDIKEVTRNIACSVTAQFSLPIHSTVLVKPGSIPKTSSGKIQRHLCRQQFINNELKAIEK